MSIPHLFRQIWIDRLFVTTPKLPFSFVSSKVLFMSDSIRRNEENTLDLPYIYIFLRLFVDLCKNLLYGSRSPTSINLV